MITTAQMAQRLRRWTSVKELSDATVDELQDLADCLTIGVQTWFRRAPDRFRRKQVTLRTFSPVTVSVGVVASGLAVTGATFTSRQYGCSIEIDGDTNRNEINGTGTLLHAYGGTTGTKTATIYADGYRFGNGDGYDRLLADPIDIGTGEKLKLDTTVTAEWENWRQGAWREPHARGTGRPRFYYIRPIGNAGGVQGAVLKLYPAPTEERNYQLDFDTEAPTYSHLDTLLATEIPVPEEYAMTSLLPLCMEALVGKPIFRGDTNAALNGLENANREILLLSNDRMKPRNQRYTPMNW